MAAVAEGSSRGRTAGHVQGDIGRGRGRAVRALEALRDWGMRHQASRRPRGCPARRSLSNNQHRLISLDHSLPAPTPASSFAVHIDTEER